jgi:rhodanese-related sulfurtransferase
MNITQDVWWEKAQSIKNAIIVDVRTPEEYEDGKIPGALNIDFYKGQGFIYLIDALDKENTIFVYCRSGSRSSQACQLMNKLGFKTVYNLNGGLIEWNGPIV